MNPTLKTVLTVVALGALGAILRLASALDELGDQHNALLEAHNGLVDYVVELDNCVHPQYLVLSETDDRY